MNITPDPRNTASAPTHTHTEVRITPVFQPRRRYWPGILGASLIGAGIAAAAVSSFYDTRTLGQRVDATVAASEQTVKNQVDGLREGTSEAARGGALATARVANALGDAGITVAVKTALAADPALSAVKIDVSTTDGVVSLAGPAPDLKSRDRAEVLAAAPEGVRRVDNRLVIAPPPTSTN